MQVNVQSVGGVLAIIALVAILVFAIMGQLTLPLAGILVLLALARLL